MRSRVPLFLAVALAASLAVPSSASGQAQPSPQGSGAITGRITDSLHARPLAGASVQAVRQGVESPTLRLALSDQSGRFLIDSLAPGRYAVSFSLPLLDSLGLVIPDHMVDVVAGRASDVQLGLPSASTFRAAACPGLELVPGQGAVIGSVVDATTEQPMPRATVVVAWVENSFDRATMRAVQQQRTGSVTADSTGSYRLCGVPSDMTLVLQVQRAGMASSAVDLMVPDSVGLVRRDLSFAATVPVTATAPAPRAAADTVAATVRLPATTGNAVLSGVVTGPDDRPIPDALVRIMSARVQARTDSLGRFTLGGLPPGTQMVEARHLGYGMARAAVELRDGRTAEQPLHLTRVVTLDSIRVLARRTLYAEFERHRSSPFGKFMDEDAIARRNPFETSDLLRMAPGFRVMGSGFDAQVVSARTTNFGNTSCPVNVVINGIPNQDINTVHPSEIAAIEMYRSPAGAPLEYQSGCGLVVIWTKR